MQILSWLWDVAAYIPPFLFVLGIIIIQMKCFGTSRSLLFIVGLLA